MKNGNDFILAGKNVNIEVKDGVAVVRIDQPDSKVRIKSIYENLVDVVNSMNYDFFPRMLNLWSNHTCWWVTRKPALGFNQN